MHTHSSDQYTLGTPHERATYAPGVSCYYQALGAAGARRARLSRPGFAPSRRPERRRVPSRRTVDDGEPAATEAAAAAAAAEPLAKSVQKSTWPPVASLARRSGRPMKDEPTARWPPAGLGAEATFPPDTLGRSRARAMGARARQIRAARDRHDVGHLPRAQGRLAVHGADRKCSEVQEGRGRKHA